jgi:ATP-dependent RNA helicase MSS116
MPSETYPKFAQLAGLHPSLKASLAKMELVTMTEIQAKTWEAASAGQDVLGRARTGTGKTVAFLLPALQQLLENLPKVSQSHVSMLVLSPTRELAAQIGEQARLLLQENNSHRSSKQVTQQVIFGGTPKPKDENAFKRQIPTILVATPGRLRDHLQTTTVKGVAFSKLLSQTQILVLDETDRCVCAICAMIECRMGSSSAG